MKEKLLYWALALFMLITSIKEVRADELVRYNSYDQYCTGSIIRHYKNGKNIVCNYSQEPYFMIVEESATTENAHFLNVMDTVCDFEIYNDTVYFCGRKLKSSGGGKCAAYGYFPVAGLFEESMCVRYVEIPEMHILKAIEIEWFAARKHVVAIGKDNESYSKILDAIDELTYWNTNINASGTDSVDFEDLTITDNYVVITSTKKVTGDLRIGHIWYVEKPITPGDAIFPSMAKIVKTSKIIGGKFLVKAMGNDSIFTAFTYGLFETGTLPFCVSIYNFMTLELDYIIDENEANYISLRDISLEKEMRGMLVLLHGEYETPGGTVFRSVIYEVYTKEPLWDIHAEAHIYDEVRFESLDYTGRLDHFVSSGYKNETTNRFPFFLKFKYRFVNGDCLNYKFKRLLTKKLKMNNYTKTLENISSVKEEELFCRTNKKMEMVTQCVTYRDDDEKK